MLFGVNPAQGVLALTAAFIVSITIVFWTRDLYNMNGNIHKADWTSVEVHVAMSSWTRKRKGFDNGVRHTEDEYIPVDGPSPQYSFFRRFVSWFGDVVEDNGNEGPLPNQFEMRHPEDVYRKAPTRWIRNIPSLK
jgi:hypothetical protein